MAEQTDADKHEAFEKRQEKDGVAIHLPRGPVDPATGKVAEEKKPAKK